MKIERKRTEVILEIMKEKGFEEGITLKDLYVKIQNHQFFYEYFEKTNAGWKAAVRRLLQNSSPNSNHYLGNRKDFYFIVKGLWTYFGNPRNEENISKRSTVHKDIEKFLEKIKTTDYTKQEKTALIKTRINQTHFRKYLINEFNECPIKKVKLQKLLIASHIVDYADCEEEEEKANPYNGMLLSPDVDKLFDKKIITFEPKHGKIIIKKEFKDEVKKMGVNDDICLPESFLNNQRQEFFRQRNEKYFK